GMLLRSDPPKIIHVCTGAFDTLALQLDKNFGIRGSNGSRAAVTKIDAAIGQTYIVQNRSDLILRNHLTNGLIDLIGQACGFFNAKAGASTQVQAYLAGVNFGEEIAAKNDYQRC